MDKEKKPLKFSAKGVTFEEATFASLGLDPEKMNMASDDVSSMKKDDSHES